MSRSSPRPGLTRRRSGRSSSPRSARYRRAIELGCATRPSCAHYRPAPLPGRAGQRGPGVLQPDPGGRPAHRRPGADGLAVRPGQSRLPPGRGDRAQGGRGQPRRFPGPDLAGPGPDARQRRHDEAEAVLRKAIDAAKADPDRWISLVRFLVLTRQAEKAEQAVREAEAQHRQPQPLALAQCCEMVGKAYAAGDPDRAKTWYGQARGWFAKAQAGAEGPQRPDGQAPASPSSSSRPTSSPRPRGRSRRSSRGPPTASRPTLAAWARRSLAQVYVAPTRRGPPRPWPSSPARRADGAEPDDLRVLAMIHEVQGTRRAAGGPSTTSRRWSAARPPRPRTAPAGPAPGGRRRMAPGPRAVPRADPADRRRARRRDDRPAAHVHRPVRRGACSATTSPATTIPTWPRPGSWSRSSSRSSATRWSG